MEMEQKELCSYTPIREKDWLFEEVIVIFFLPFLYGSGQEFGCRLMQGACERAC
jgi:hypothetical protein